MINKTLIVANRLIEESKKLENVNKQFVEDIHKLEAEMGLAVRKTQTIDELTKEEERLETLSRGYEKIYANKEKIRNGEIPFEQRVEISEQFEKVGLKISYWATEDNELVENASFKEDCEKILTYIEKYKDMLQKYGENSMQIRAIVQALKNVADRKNSVLEGDLKEYYTDAKEYLEKTTIDTKKDFYEQLIKYSQNNSYTGIETINQEELLDVLEIEEIQDEMKSKFRLYDKIGMINESENQSSTNRMDMINNSILRTFAEKTESSLEQLGYYSGKWNPVAMNFSKEEYLKEGYSTDIKTIQRPKNLTKKDMVEADEKFLITAEDVEKTPKLFEKFPILKEIMNKVKSVMNKDGEER